MKKSTRSPSSDSSTSSESSGASTGAIRTTGAPFTTEEVKQKILSRSDNINSRTPVSSYKESPPQKQSRYSTPTKPTVTTSASVTNDEESETSSEEETESEEEVEEEERKPDMSKTDIGPLLARSANARDNSSEGTRKTSREEPHNTPRSRYPTKKEEEETPRYDYTSRFLNKSRSTANIPPKDNDTHTSSRYGAPADDDSKYSSGRSRYMALKDRRQRLARSKSSQQFGDEDEPEEPMSPTTANPSAYLASRGYGSTTPGQDLARSRSSHALKSRDPSPERNSTSEKDGAALSSWARYLKNKYGNRSTTKEKEPGSSSTASGNSTSAAARRLSLGLPLRSSTELASSDDDSKNMHGSPTTPTAATQAAGKNDKITIL